MAKNTGSFLFIVSIFFLGGAALSGACDSLHQLQEKGRPAGKYGKLVWSDEFNYEGLPDSTKWNFDIGDGCPDLCGWGNNELQWYTGKRAKNARVENGVLKIEVHQEDMGRRQFSSAKLVTRGKADWKYGRIEVMARLPNGRGLWSAIWMMPTDTSVYGRWPNCGEIDIVEKVGFDPDTVEASAHTGAYYFTIGTQKHNRQYLPDSDKNFHRYAIEWEEDQIRYYVDDIRYFTFYNEGKGYKEWPFDQPFYLILNVAYGGNWGAAKGLDTGILPKAMEVDYVRVYQR